MRMWVLTPGLPWRVKDLALQRAVGVGQRLAAVALNRPLAWEPPYAASAPPPPKKKKKFHLMYGFFKDGIHS